MARFASIDLGSNALRMRIVDIEGPAENRSGAFPRFVDIFSERVPIRLGHDVFNKGFIDTKMIHATCEALSRFHSNMVQYKVEVYRAVATSAAREAKNGDILVERAAKEAQVKVEIIEGIEEARLVQLSVTSALPIEDSLALLIDVGGGSTELTLIHEGRTLFSESLPIGTVRLIEAFLKDRGRLQPTQQRLLEEYIHRSSSDAIKEILSILDERELPILVGTGGNIETLSNMCPAVSPVVEANAIDVSKMTQLLKDLSGKSVDERSRMYRLRPDRADTIIPASTVLKTIANAFGCKAIIAPGVGLKEGVIIDLAHQYFLPHRYSEQSSVILDACIRIGKKFQFDESHGRTVARFAVQIFDALLPSHGFGNRERILLEAAALLHDIGDFIRYEAHHKHSYYLIMNCDLMGILPEEREVIANIARYHRKSTPQLTHENFRTLDKERRNQVLILSSILRIADALDREHKGKIESIEISVEDKTLLMELFGNSERDLEEWTVMVKSDLMQEVLGLEVRIANVERLSRPSRSPLSKS